MQLKYTYGGTRIGIIHQEKLCVICSVLCGEIYSDVSSCHAIISEGKYVDINLIGIFGGMRCRLQKRRPLRAFD